MHVSRRCALGLFAGATLTAVAPRLVRADALPGVMGSAMSADGRFRVGLLDGRLGESEGTCVPMRLHALSPRPDGLEAVAVARRPGDLALVLDGKGADVRSTFKASAGRRFSGHGAYSVNGATFLSAEIDAETGDGFVVVRNVANGYAQRSEFSTAGVGPHELIPLGGRVAVANGAREPKSEPGIAALGRTTARSNLALVDAATGATIEIAEVEDDFSTLSLRHLVSTPAGGVIVGAQDTKAGARDLPLVARLEGSKLRWFEPGYEISSRFGGYIGQLSLDVSGRYLAASGPKGGVVGVFDLATDEALGVVPAPDCCAVAADGRTGGFIASTGLGEVIRIAAHDGGVAIVDRRLSALRWDNHLVTISNAAG